MLHIFVVLMPVVLTRSEVCNYSALDPHLFVFRWNLLYMFIHKEHEVDLIRLQRVTEIIIKLQDTVE